jgi:ribosomal protein L14E/L6E/L27E
MDKQIKAGEMVFVKVGKMAGTYAVVSSVQDKFVYLRHLVTNIEFRCKIGDVA